jgi:hypothetical protein
MFGYTQSSRCRIWHLYMCFINKSASIRRYNASQPVKKTATVVDFRTYGNAVGSLWHIDLTGTRSVAQLRCRTSVISASLLKTKDSRSLETSITARPTTRRHNPEQLDPQLHRCANLQSRILPLFIPHVKGDQGIGRISNMGN